MSVSALLVQARAKHQELMVDTCIIDRPSRGTLNTSTGNYTPTYTTKYSGVCRVKGPGAGSITVTDKQAGESEHDTQRQTLVLPHGVALTIDVGDRVRVTGGGVFTVVGQVDATSMTARSVLIEAVGFVQEVDGGESPGAEFVATWDGGDATSF